MTRDLRGATAASSAASRNSASIARLVGLEQPRADVLAQLVEAVEAGVDREILVDARQLLELDLLDGHGEHGVPAGELLGRVVGRECQLHVLLLAGARADERLLEARDQVAAAELDELVAALAALERLQALLAVRRRRTRSEPT